MTLHFGQVHCVRLDDASLGFSHSGDLEAIGADRFNVRRPRIDQGDVMAVAGKMTADISADRAGTDERYSLFHCEALLVRTAIAATALAAIDQCTKPALRGSNNDNSGMQMISSRPTNSASM